MLLRQTLSQNRQQLEDAALVARNFALAEQKQELESAAEAVRFDPTYQFMDPTENLLNAGNALNLVSRRFSSFFGLRVFILRVLLTLCKHSYAVF